MKREKGEKKVLIQGKVVDVYQISHIQAEDYMSIIYYQDKTSQVFTKKLGKIQHKLEDVPFLYRVHKSTIVNLKIFKKFIKGKRYFFLTKNNDELKISRDKKSEFKSILKKLEKKAHSKTVPFRRNKSMISINSYRSGVDKYPQRIDSYHSRDLRK